MSYKYTISVAATVTTTDEYAALVGKIDAATRLLGTAVVVSNINANMWIDPTTMEPQQFNPDGSPYVPPETETETETETEAEPVN